MQRTWDKEAILELLDKSDRAVYRALQALYARQTADERASQQTRWRNGMGFNGHDAEFLSDVARKSQRYGSLTDGQCRAVRKMIRKYWRQLVKIANENEATKAAPVLKLPSTDDVDTLDELVAKIRQHAPEALA